MISRLRNGESGYSMVEVVVAILILSIAILPMVSMFDAGLRAAVLGGNYDKGRALANTNLESVKGLSYTEVVTEYPPGPSESCPETEPDFTCDVETFYVDAELDDAVDQTEVRTRMRVEVRVGWQGENDRYTVSGLLTQGAL